ncbi:MAG: tRNA 2-thiouridine(34) synthase MnmA [Patescibacteria group bacterium]|nr:tRNA 2-thiouridine(34) synthase MnmA [Patescibacteria group bacterium]MDD4304875.1 tRNA 2-thiouridine(34) synthase MnmA [Patescibacteria group bacterium]MDD4695786.1 tRNA 2-thiouridine(34) synthase MnmA [Patescibacteria group bacterium]
MINKKIKVAVGLSGGVDSSVCAYLLKKQGYDVVGYYMKNWSQDLGKFKCPWKEDRDYALRTANFLGIPFYTLNFEKEYKQKVVDYLFDGYAKGITPNPDIMCNKEIKFKLFLEKAMKLGADFIATGHYSQIKKDKNLCHLLKAKDGNKDQSYFLYTLNQHQLLKTIFPIGGYTKPQIRQIAKRAKLPTATKPDSQGICFIGEVDIRELLKTQIKPRVGDIITTDGEKIGEHEGVWYYTIGQRKGIGIGGGIPYFVVEKDMEKNILKVAKGSWSDELFREYCIVKDMHFIANIPKFPLDCTIKTRYRQKDEPCTVYKEDKSYKIVFKNKQRAITSGQSAVLYKKTECLGGGIIV